MGGVDLCHPVALTYVTAFASAPGLIWRSKDRGKNWQDSSSNILALTATRGMSLASFDDEVWAGGYVQPGLGIRKPLVLRGADSGEHWDDRSPAALPLSDECRALALDPADTSIVYAGNCFALFESKDGGEHWQAAFVSRALQGVSSLVFDPSDSQTVYIATRGNGIYRYAGLVV